MERCLAQESSHQKVYFSFSFCGFFEVLVGFDLQFLVLHECYLLASLLHLLVLLNVATEVHCILHSEKMFEDMFAQQRVLPL